MEYIFLKICFWKIKKKKLRFFPKKYEFNILIFKSTVTLMYFKRNKLM